MAVAALASLPLFLAENARAQGEDRRLPPLPHEHPAVEIDGAPIVARIEVSVERPRRVLLDGSGHVYVVDSAAGRVVRVDPQGGGTTVAEGLDEPAGIAIDRDGSLCVANHAGGQEGRGSIVRVSPMGRVTILARGLTGPGALTLDARGRLFVGLFEADEIAIVERDGRTTTFVRDIVAPAGLAFDGDDLLVVSSGPGTLSRITRDGNVRVLARGLEFPTDVALNSRGQAVVANYAGRELTEIDATGRSRPFASVPPGTIGLALDADDNPYLANWDFRLVMRMTLQLSVPCPHCDQRIPVRIRPRMGETARDVF